jgi:cytochrome c oxidase cbb3-type subunit 3
MPLGQHAIRGGLVLLLAACTGPRASAGEPVAADRLYASHCAHCHGEAGRGDGLAAEALEPRPTDFTRPELWRERTAQQTRDLIRDGKPATAMVPFAGVLDAEEIDALAAYLRRFAAP